MSWGEEANIATGWPLLAPCTGLVPLIRGPLPGPSGLPCRGGPFLASPANVLSA